MKTKLDYYRVFYLTARHESFSAAAEELFVSQSAISQCINQLERDLNTHLFERSRRGVKLTREGVLLFSKIESAMQYIEQGETLLNRLQHLESGSLTIAAGDTITSEYLLPLLKEFHQKYPDIRIEMANSYSSQMLECLKEGRAELAFVNLPAECDDELIIKPCKQIHDIFVCAVDYDAKKSYTPSEMARENLILLEENSNSRRYLNDFFKEKRIKLEPHIEMAAHGLLIQFASINLGVACIVEEFSKEYLDKGIVKKMNLEPAIPPRSIGYAYLKNNTLSPAAKVFLAMIEE